MKHTEMVALVAAAIATARRSDDLRAMGRNAPGDVGTFLPMDMRAAQAVFAGLDRAGLVVVPSEATPVMTAAAPSGGREDGYRGVWAAMKGAAAS